MNASPNVSTLNRGAPTSYIPAFKGVGSHLLSVSRQFFVLRLLSGILKLPNILGALRAALSRWLQSSTGWLLTRALSGRLRTFEQRFFVIRRWHAVIASVAGFKLLRWVLKLFLSRSAARQARLLRQRMSEADTYEDWVEHACALDALEGHKATPSALADGTKGLVERTAILARMRQQDDVHGLMWALRQDGSRNVGAMLGVAAEESRVHCLMPPPAVEAYIAEMHRALQHVCHHNELSLDERLAFVRELRHAYGRTGLVLSGGGSFGHWHFGVVLSLLRAGLLPRVMSGSSAGSIAVAMLCTRTDLELETTVGGWITSDDNQFFGTPTGREMLTHLIKRGTLHAADEYIQRLQRLFGDITFQEAFARTGRVLNIAVVAADTKEPCRLLNYLTAPHVLIWSAVACSSAFPLLFAPQTLKAKNASGNIVSQGGIDSNGNGNGGGVDGTAPGSLRRWCDGSLEEDLPMRGLAEQFNINYFLVSQCNPYLVPVLAIQRLFPRYMQRLGEWELKHRISQLLEIWPRSRLLKLLCQPWTGDLNFVLPFSAFPLLRSAVNFTQQEIKKAMEEGQRAVWGKLPALRAACAVEVAIDGQLRALTVQSQAAARREEHAAALAVSCARISSRLPSWLDLRSLGLPNSTSNEDVASMASLDYRNNYGSTGSLAGVAEGNEVIEGKEATVGDGRNREGKNPPLQGEVQEGEVQRLESGMDAWRDVTALAIGAEGLDIIAP